MAKYGMWIVTEGEDDIYDVCSECGARFVSKYPRDVTCPNCGADMIGKETDKKYEMHYPQVDGVTPSVVRGRCNE